MIDGSTPHVVSSFTIDQGRDDPGDLRGARPVGLLRITKKPNLDRLPRRELHRGLECDLAHATSPRCSIGVSIRQAEIVPWPSWPRSGSQMEEWKPILLWHITRDEFLLRDFLDQLARSTATRTASTASGQRTSTTTCRSAQRARRRDRARVDRSDPARVATGLLKIATDFGLLTEGVVKEFANYHVPERSLRYLLHAILEHEAGSPVECSTPPEWRMYLMRDADLETELLRLHQFQRSTIKPPAQSGAALLSRLSHRCRLSPRS